MKITVEVEIYKDGGGTERIDIPVESSDIAGLAEDIARIKYECLSAKATKILWSALYEEL